VACSRAYAVRCGWLLRAVAARGVMRRSCGAASALLLLLVALPGARAGVYDPCSTSTSKVTKARGPSQFLQT